MIQVNSDGTGSGYYERSIVEELRVRHHLPEILQDRPITFAAWLIGGLVVALLIALLV